MDITWELRFSKYKKALLQLDEAILLMGQRALSNLEKQGVVHEFEFTHELAWNTMKDFFESKGNTEIYGSKDAVRQAFKYGIISDGDVWIKMILSRNITSHTYDEKTFDEIVDLVSDEYINAFRAFKSKLETLESVI